MANLDGFVRALLGVLKQGEGGIRMELSLSDLHVRRSGCRFLRTEHARSPIMRLTETAHDLARKEEMIKGSTSC